MNTHAGSLIRAIRQLARLKPEQIAQLNKRLDSEIDRMATKRKRYLYVVVSVALDDIGRPLPGMAKIEHGVYEAKRKESVFAAGQERFNTMTTTDQLMADTVIELE